MKNNHKTILIYILTVLILGIFIYAVPKVTDSFETTTVLEQGAIQVKEEASCYFVRKEAVYEAGAAGTIKYKIKEGTHIRTGTSLASFDEDNSDNSEVMAARTKYAEIIENVGSAAVRTKNFVSKSSGIVCYFADGYEAKLTPEKMAGISREEAMEITSKGVELKQSPVRKNEPVLKICDNDNWYIMCWVESASIANYEIGSSVSIILPDGTVKMEVDSITQEGDYWKIIFWSNNYYENFGKCRVEEGIIMSRYYEGLKTETSNIIADTTDEEYPGRPVVLTLKKNGEYDIVPVKVIANDGEYSILADVSFVDKNDILQDTVEIYDEILKKPAESDLKEVREAQEREKNEE